MNPLLAVMIPKLLDSLPPDQVRIWLDQLLDAVEDRIDATETQKDDLLLEPMISMIRIALNIPDDIAGDKD